MSADILKDLAAEHADIRRMFSAFTGMPFHDPERKQLVDQATVSLLQQVRVEEMCLYPVARDLPGGEQIIQQGLAENTEIEALLGELGHSDQDTPGFARLVAQLVERATAHANREEAQLFPALRATLSDQELAHASQQAETIRADTSPWPRPAAVAALPGDDLPPPERSIKERAKDLLRPAGSGQQPAYTADSASLQDTSAAQETASPQLGGTGLDVIQILLDQHTQVKGLFAQFKAAVGRERQEAFDQLRNLLAAHEAGEEAVLRPVSQKAAGEQVAQARNAEEKEADAVLAELEKLEIAGPDFAAKFAQFEQAVLAHAEREETEEFPAVRAQCTESELQQLGQRLLTAEHSAPTPFRASAPADSKPGHQATGPVAAIVGKVRDALH